MGRIRVPFTKANVVSGSCAFNSLTVYAPDCEDALKRGFEHDRKLVRDQSTFINPTKPLVMKILR
jgi:hypothetical protein